MAATVATALVVRRIDIPETEWIVRDGFGQVVSRVTAASESDARRAARDSEPRTRLRNFTVADTGCLLRASVDASVLAGIVGTDTWELLEQHLAELHRGRGWAAGTYRAELTGPGGTSVVSLEREMPLPPAYAALTYKTPPRYRPGPIRAAVVLLAASYPGAALGQVAGRYPAFRAHFDGKVSSRELEEATGYAPRDVAVPDAAVPAAEDQAR